MPYRPTEVEKRWKKFWQDNKTFEVKNSCPKPKYYILDMFPYPSGAGLHVGHPLGYIASDIIARYKRSLGFNVLHPMGYDSFGLPAEQYAIQTGQHPAITTAQNIKTYREQMDQIGLSFDWSRQVVTSDPNYYKWTQWIFLKLFNSYYDPEKNKAMPIPQENSAAYENKRLAYLADQMVNWCPALGTVLANDEVKEGYSVRGNHPVFQKKMKQWCLRISVYADRLLEGLETLDWPLAVKEMQRNWIGRSTGAEVEFFVENFQSTVLIYTTRLDTIFGATFLVLAPENSLVLDLTTEENRAAVEEYISSTAKRTERERQTEQNKITGQFLGSYALHPFTKKKIPIYISEYVLNQYGTGAIMAVPAHDQRDYLFAKKFHLPIQQVIAGENVDISTSAYESKSGTLINSDFLNNLTVEAAIESALQKLGKRKVNFRMRDAIFSRQRYWGEPIPIFFENGKAKAMEEKDLPLILPEVDKYLPTEKGEPPLGRALNWKTKEGHPIELSTMPGFAGSSAYFLRYMDPHNSGEFVSSEAIQYWKDVDLYIGGSEHATGHLLYSRFWHKFLFDLGIAPTDEPFKKLVNQGMILGRSSIAYRLNGQNQFVSYNLKDHYPCHPVHVDVNLVIGDCLEIEKFKKSKKEYETAEFILETDGSFHCGAVVEKMSKSFFNVVRPDDLIERYGADTFRLYEMFLGPLDQSKPWNTQGIEGSYRFLGKLLRLFFTEDKDEYLVTDETPTQEEQKILHKTIKKVTNDLELLSFNTCVGQFMICVNELNRLQCHKKSILEPLVVLLAPFTPHLCEELWNKLGNPPSVAFAPWPKWSEELVQDDSFQLPISFNGKMRFTLEVAKTISQTEVEKMVFSDERTHKYLEGKKMKKFIYVSQKIVNIVF